MTIVIAFHGSGYRTAAALTPGNTDDRKPVPELTQDLFGKLFGDRGYISRSLFESRFDRGLALITKRRKNMKNSLMPMLDKLLLRKRPMIETVNDPLKNLCQIVRAACRRQTFASSQSLKLPCQPGLGSDRLCRSSR
jgi:hypothetical protein